MDNDITAGLRVPSQRPLDVKLYVLTYAELESLGAADFKAFRYYKGMTIYCAENEKLYRWRTPVDEVEVGVLANHYTYPVGAVSFGIDYSGQAYNLFPTLEAGDIAIQNIGTGVAWYKDFVIVDGVKYFNFRTFKVVDVTAPEGVSIINSIVQGAEDITLEVAKIASNNLLVSKVDGVVYVDAPSTFTGVDYYVNSNYSGTGELGTAAKPFKTLQRCIDVILNRDSINNPGFPDPAINGGTSYNKWDLRTDQLFDGAIRVIIQSAASVTENLAINRVTYFLERGGYNSSLFVSPSGLGSSLEYIIDMKELVDNIPKVAGQLPYQLDCSIIGNGAVLFEEGHTSRLGFIRGTGHNDGNMTTEQKDCNLFVGSIGGYIIWQMYKNESLSYVPLYSDAGNTVPIIREGVHMTGLQTTSVPDYGAFEVQGANAQFRDSLFLNGTNEIYCYEQHLLYLKDFGAIYGDNGRIYIRRNYQHINFSSVEDIDINPGNPTVIKFYKPCEHVYDIYLKNGATFSYAGDFYSQENTGYSQGGSEAFVCLENNTTDIEKMCGFNCNGGGKVVNLFYNHYIKYILNPIFNDYTHHNITLKELSLDSSLFSHAVSIVDTSDVAWTKIVILGRLINTLINELMYGGVIRRPFTNSTINTLLFLDGNAITLGKGVLDANIPVYADNAAALAGGYHIGGRYRDASGNVKNVI